MARLARALLALVAIVVALVLWRGEVVVGLDFRGGGVLELEVADGLGIPANEALEQVRHGVEGRPFDADVRVRGERIVVEGQDIGEAELDQILRAVQAVDLRFLAVTPSPWWGDVERAELGAARIGACGRAPDLEADARGDLDAALARLPPPPADRLVVIETSDGKVVAYLAEREPVLQGRDVAEASVRAQAPGLEPVVRLVLRADAAERFGRATAALKGDCLAMVLDGAVITAPVIREAIAGGEINLAMGLSGDAADASRVARALSAGRHIPLEVAFRTVVPSVYPSWLGLPVLQALAWMAALATSLAALRRPPARWLPLVVGVVGAPLVLSVVGTIGGTLTLASFVGALPAALAAALVVALAGRCAPGTSLGGRFIAAWPGWLALVAAAALAGALRPLGGYWGGFGIAGVVAFPCTLVLAAIGVVATADARSAAEGEGGEAPQGPGAEGREDREDRAVGEEVDEEDQREEGDEEDRGEEDHEGPGVGEAGDDAELRGGRSRGRGGGIDHPAPGVGDGSAQGLRPDRGGPHRLRPVDRRGPA